MTDPLDLDALETVARSIESEPWRGVDSILDMPSYTVFAPGNRQVALTGNTDTTHYVATFDPPTVLALIAALKEARAGLADAWDAGASAGAASMYHGLKATPNPYRRTETP